MKKFFSSIILSALLLIQPTTHAGWFTDTLTDNPVAHWINNHPYTVGIACSLIMLIAYIKAPRVMRALYDFKAAHESLDTKLKRVLDNAQSDNPMSSDEHYGSWKLSFRYNVLRNSPYQIVITDTRTNCRVNEPITLFFNKDNLPQDVQQLKRIMGI